MKKQLLLIVLGICINWSCLNSSTTTEEKQATIDCKYGSISSLVNDNSQNCHEIKLALMEFNTQAKSAFSNNDFFSAAVYGYFQNTMQTSQIAVMMDNLRSNFDNTGKLLKMIMHQYGNDKQSLFLAFSSLKISAKSCDVLADYTLTNSHYW